MKRTDFIRRVVSAAVISLALPSTLVLKAFGANDRARTVANFAAESAHGRTSAAWAPPALNFPVPARPAVLARTSEMLESIAGQRGDGLTKSVEWRFNQVVDSAFSQHHHHGDDACSNETLSGTYAFRTDAHPTTGGERLNLALIRFHGDGTFDNLGFTTNTDGVVAHGTVSGLYIVNNDCSGFFLDLAGVEQGPFIVKSDGSEYYFLRTNPSSLMLAGTGTRVSMVR